MKKLSCIFCLTLLVLAGCSSQPNRITEEHDFDQVKAAKTRISLGLTYLKNGNYSQAKYNLDKAMQFAPRSADAHFALAYYYQQVEEQEAAEKAYQTAMDIEPGNADIANSYGAFLCQRGKYAEAKRYFLKAVNSDNYISSAETYENLALCSQTHGQFEDALQYLRSAVNHQPGRAKSLYLLAQLLAESSHWVEAKDVLRRYEKVSQVSPNSLLLASKIESALGNTQASDGYGEMLLRMYPSDPATASYLQQRRKASSVTLPLERKSSKTLLVESPVTVPVERKSSKTLLVESPVTLPVERESNKTVFVESRVIVEAPAKKALTLENKNTIQTKSLVVEESDIPVVVVVNEPAADIPVALVVSEPKADVPVAAAVSKPVADIPVAATVSEPKADIPVAATVSEPKADIPVAVTVSEPKADIPVAATVSEPKADIPVAAVVSKPVADIAVAVTVSEAKADIPVAATVSEPESEISDAVQEGSGSIASSEETTENELVENVPPEGLAFEEDLTEVVESSPNKDVITHNVENSQEIEHAEIVVVEDSESLTEQPHEFHIVQKEDNLYRISLRYNIKMQRLIEWNNLPDAASIYVGKKLIIVAPENQE